MAGEYAGKCALIFKTKNMLLIYHKTRRFQVMRRHTESRSPESKLPFVSLILTKASEVRH